MCGAFNPSPALPPARPPLFVAAPRRGIQDKSRPGDWNKPEGLTILPPESELELKAVDRFKAFFSADSISGALAK